jgi:Skp family chaperone for outer membrane proteins
MTKTVYKMAIVPALAASLAIVGCGRTDRAADENRTGEPVTTATTAADQQRNEYINRMEQRVAQLEQRLADMKAQGGTAAVNQDRIESLQSDVQALRQEINDLRNTRADNWWPTTERSMERSRQHIEEDMTRWGQAGTADRARTMPRETPRETPRDTTDMTRSTPVGEGTHGANDFTAQRERFAARMEADIKALERDLDRYATRARGTARDGVEDVRAQLNDLRQQVSELRNVDEGSWWDATQRRLDRTAERIERSIENLGRNNNTNQKR